MLNERENSKYINAIATEDEERKRKSVFQTLEHIGSYTLELAYNGSLKLCLSYSSASEKLKNLYLNRTYLCILASFLHLWLCRQLTGMINARLYSLGIG